LPILRIALDLLSNRKLSKNLIHRTAHLLLKLPDKNLCNRLEIHLPPKKFSFSKLKLKKTRNSEKRLGQPSRTSRHPRKKPQEFKL